MEQGVAFNSINFTSPNTHRTASNGTVVNMAISSFLCPSDPNSNGLTAFPTAGVFARVPCYGVNEGDWYIWNGYNTTSGTDNGPNTRGVFAPDVCRRLAEFTDGSSQTILASDVKALQPFCQANPISEVPTPTSPLPSPNASPIATIAEYSTGSCNTNPQTGQAHTAWVDGNSQETGMTTAFPPNKAAINPSNQADMDIMTLLISKNLPIYGALTARSYHSGGVNTLFADGSVRFIKSSIDGNTWRALGLDPRGEVVSGDAF